MAVPPALGRGESHVGAPRPGEVAGRGDDGRLQDGAHEPTGVGWKGGWLWSRGCGWGLGAWLDGVGGCRMGPTKIYKFNYFGKKKVGGGRGGASYHMAQL